MARYTTHVQGVSSGTSLLTVLQLTAGAQRLGLYGIAVSFKGASSTAVPPLVRIARTTTSGTSSATPTIVSVDGSGVTSTATSAATFTVEPTLSDILWAREIHPQTGWAEWIPLGDEFVIAASTRVAVSVLAAATVPITTQLYWREGH
ncbi:hypothetical protein AB0L53_54745 [Nonomuraea sp. NPDC052129]|uniref:hypothetical protein n=1 Tax=Nonomuraea sp. NPDC052129 TaxID=3154651 RepID=UPI003445912C